MSKSTHTEAQIVGALKQLEAGRKAEDVAREMRVSRSTLYTWKAKYGGMEVSEAQEAKRLRDENARSKKLVTGLALDANAIEAMQNLLLVYREIMRAHNIDLPSLLANFAERESSLLKAAKSDYRELCGKGCSLEILSANCWLLRNTSNIQEFISYVFGTSRDRRRRAAAAARVMADLETFMVPVQPKHGQTDWLPAIDDNPLAKLADNLKAYLEALDMPDRIVKHLGARSLPQFLKFLLTAYVRLATGKWQDRNVSAIIAESLRERAYNVEAHRMWRDRNCSRFSRRLATPLTILKDFGVALTLQRNTL
jgi:putative transposase